MVRLLLSLVLVSLVPLTAQAGSIVKKTGSGLCHPPQSSYYDRIKTFKTFANLDACLASGGRLPERLQGALVQGAANDDVCEREDFGHGWREGPDPDCQDTRAELLVAQSSAPVSFATGKQCRVVGGEWIGFFSNRVFRNAGEMDVDHVVALNAACDMGASGWSDDKREEFANDPLNLKLVSASLNRSKGDRSPAEWMPPANQCQYVARWLSVVAKYNLEPDDPTMDAVIRFHNSCQEESANA